jgi:hypothetical protein
MTVYAQTICKVVVRPLVSVIYGLRVFTQSNSKISRYGFNSISGVNRRLIFPHMKCDSIFIQRSVTIQMIRQRRNTRLEKMA